MSTLLIVTGEPVAKGRPRFIGGRGMRPRAYTPKKSADFEKKIAAEIAAAPQDTFPRGPVSVDLEFYCTRPKRLNRKSDSARRIAKDTRPDIDNYAKAVLDGLKSIWGDDGQVADLRARKFYAEKDGMPRTVIYISKIQESVIPPNCTDPESLSNSHE